MLAVVDAASASDGGLLVIKVGVPDESRGGMSDGWLDLLETDGTVTRIHEEGPIGGDVVVCGARVAWTTAYGNGDSDAPLVVYDAATGDLWRIDEPHQYGRLMCAGDYLTFTQLFPETDLTAATTVIRWTAPQVCLSRCLSANRTFVPGDDRAASPQSESSGRQVC